MVRERGGSDVARIAYALSQSVADGIGVAPWYWRV